MPNLLMVTSLGSAKDLASGKQGAFYNTLKELHQHWKRVDIIVPKIKNHLSGTRELFGNVYLHVSSWPLIFHPIWFLKKGLEIYKKQRFDLMTVQEFPPFYNGIGARLLWQKIKVPYVLEIHHIPGYPKAANFKEKVYAQSWLWKLYWKFFGSKAKAVRVVNQKQVPEFLKKAGVPDEKIRHISSLYIDLETFRTTNLEKKFDLIFIGRLVENKGVNLFLETVKKLDATAVIVGSGPLEKEIKLKIEDWKLKVDFHGWAKNSQEIAELLNKSKILIMPSYNEGNPRVVMEAMACGVPVLATPVGIVPDVIQGAGETIDWSVEDIAKKAKELLVDRAKYNSYSQTGPEIAKRFEKKAMIKNYADKLKELIN